MSRLYLPRSVVRDPPGLDGQRFPAIFNTDALRTRGMAMIAKEMRDPNDEKLIATLIAHGQPRFAAEQVRHSPQIRFLAAQFWCWVQDAAEGNGEAKEKVDYHRACWEQMRRDEWISETPDHTIGFAER